MIYTIKLAPKKAEEFKEGFPDGIVPVSSLRVDYDPKTEGFFYHFDISVLTKKQSDFLIKYAKENLGVPDWTRDEDILARAAIMQPDALCPACGAEGVHNCQAEKTEYPEPEGDEDLENDFEVLEEEEEEDDSDLFEESEK